MPKLTQNHVERRQRQLLDAAAACFSSKGIHGTTVPDISRRAQVSVGTLYRHFGSKERLIIAVAERICRQDALIMERLLAVARPFDHGVALDSIVLERLEDFVSAREARLRIELWAEAPLHPALRAVLRQGLENTVEKAEEALRETNGQYGTATTEARKVIGLLQGAILYRALGVS